MFGMKKSQVHPVTASDAKKIVETFMKCTTQYAKRPASDDLVKINRACTELKIPVTVENCSLELKYLYFMRPRKLMDYQKLLTPKARMVFSAAFGTDDIMLYKDGEYIVLETPGAKNEVHAADILRNDEYYTAGNLKVAVGKNTKGQDVFVDLDAAPHLLIAGETGSGKSVLMHQMIVSLLINHSAAEVQLYMVDPKRTEFSFYNGLKNVTMVYDATDAVEMLRGLCDEMGRRYNMICRAGCRDIASYNEKAKNPLSRKVVFIDELSDLMSRGLKKQTEAYIVRLAQLARACGIHLVIATQRPDRTVVTGLIKDNIPTRVCLSVSSGVNSRIILDRMGGEKLNGKGDLLYLGNGAHDTVRCQAGNITEEEIKAVVAALKRR